MTATLVSGVQRYDTNSWVVGRTWKSTQVNLDSFKNVAYGVIVVRLAGVVVVEPARLHRQVEQCGHALFIADAGGGAHLRIFGRRGKRMPILGTNDEKLLVFFSK